MPKCRPTTGDGTNPIQHKARVSGKHRGTLEPAGQAIERHLALLTGGHLSQTADGIKRAIVVRKLQRDYGTRYVQRLLERASRQRAIHGQSGIDSREKLRNCSPLVWN